MEKMPERALVQTWTQCFSLFLSNSAGLAHVFRVETYSFCWALQKSCSRDFCAFLKAMVVVPQQLGPAHRSFHPKSWADLLRTLQMNHLPTAGRDLRCWTWVIRMDDHAWKVVSLWVVVRGCDSGSSFKSPAGGAAISLSWVSLKHVWSPRPGT